MKHLVTFALFLSASALGQESRFAGTWQAKYKDTVICTIRLVAGSPMTGESADCHVSIDENGEVRAPESTDPTEPQEILNARVQGDALLFEEKDGADVLSFRFQLVGEGKAELTFPEIPMKVKPIPFSRK